MTKAQPIVLRRRGRCERSWREIEKITEAVKHWRERARTEWKYKTWKAGWRLRMQVTSGRSQCNGGAKVRQPEHRSTPRRGAYDLDKHVQPRPYANPEAASRKLLQIAHAIEPAQDDRIFIE